MIRVLSSNQHNIFDVARQAAELIQAGGMIIYPTDTVYGLGADATNDRAAKKIFELKGRKEGRGIASIFRSINQIRQYCQVTFEQEKALRQYLPGPFTFLLNPIRNMRLARSLIDRGQGTVGVRMPNHPFTRALAEILNKPYTCTSANVSGLPSPKTADEAGRYLHSLQPIPDRLGQTEPESEIAEANILLIDGGMLTGQPSTVVDLTKTPSELVRQGAGEWEL